MSRRCPGCTAFRWKWIGSTATGSSLRGDSLPEASWPWEAAEGIAMLSTVLLFKDALYGALLIAVACSVLGVYVVLRRIVFVGAALAQISSAGIALALWLAGRGWGGEFPHHPVAFALIFALAGALFFGVGHTPRAGVPPDATIGVTYAVAASAGILLIAKAAVGEAHDIFLQGNILGITRADTFVLLGIAVPVLLE